MEGVRVKYDNFKKFLADSAFWLSIKLASVPVETFLREIYEWVENEPNLTIEQITEHVFEETGLSQADFSAEQVAKFQLYIEYFLLMAKQIDWKR
jgi:hypothetical protein